jgi:hypothetical protein
LELRTCLDGGAELRLEGRDASGGDDVSVGDILGPGLGCGPAVTLGLQTLLELLDRVATSLGAALGLGPNPALLAELLSVGATAWLGRR